MKNKNILVAQYFVFHFQSLSVEFSVAEVSFHHLAKIGNVLMGWTAQHKPNSTHCNGVPQPNTCFAQYLPSTHWLLVSLHHSSESTFQKGSFASGTIAKGNSLQDNQQDPLTEWKKILSDHLASMPLPISSAVCPTNLGFCPRLSTLDLQMEVQHLVANLLLSTLQIMLKITSRAILQAEALSIAATINITHTAIWQQKQH